jgi:RNA polymerase sigma-70 factor (ECF subfamily)
MRKRLRKSKFSPMSIAIHQPFILPLNKNFDGDKGDFESLFQHQYQPLCRFAYSLVESDVLAEEIVSDVFIKIWKNRDQLIIKSSLQSYLITAVRNQSIDYLRKMVRQRTQPEEHCKSLPSNYSNPEESAISDELESQIERAIDSLPRQGRTIFRMSRDQGLKYHEIAEQMQISVKTVETHMGRSLKYLREVLKASHAF